MNRNCPSCGATYKIGPEHVGRSVKCQGCGSALVVRPEGLALDQPPPQAPIASQDSYSQNYGVPGGMPPNTYGQAGYGQDYGGYDQGYDDRDQTYDRRPQRRSRPSGEMSPVMEFLLFRRMIAPVVLQVLFWVAVVVAEIGLLVTAVMAFANGNWLYGIGGFLGMFFFPFLLRLYTELLIVAFQIHDELRQIREELKKTK
ncbi:MAG: DUF4282 domain-containing protein [Gemmataceae bacterium]